MFLKFSFTALLFRSVAFALGMLSVASAGAGEKADVCTDNVLLSIAEHYKIQNLRVTDADSAPSVLIAQTCKQWPYDKNITLAAVGYSRSPVNVEVGVHEQGLVVAMLDHVSGRFISGHHDTSLVADASFAIGEHSLQIDTARYDLAPGVRAFGVVINSAGRGPSCPDISAESELTLWIREGENLRAVMGTNLTGAVGLDGPLCSIGDWYPEVATANLTVGVEKTVTHGFADLSLTARDFDNPKRVLARTVLKYDGYSYGVDMLRTFWFPPEKEPTHPWRATSP